ncbi:hypothetical protein BLOT_007245 [Blomia tropicalis]|nr:hypothetical protein BLOT_007245 [Blomia tropicalis]
MANDVEQRIHPEAATILINHGFNTNVTLTQCGVASVAFCSVIVAFLPDVKIEAPKQITNAGYTTTATTMNSLVSVIN